MTIYLDNSATTPVRQEVVDAMLPYLTESFGNPSSIHSVGRKSKKALQTAREQVAEMLNCDPQEVHFSPCGTISNNVAILGRARFAEANGHGKHMITTRIEHPSVLGPAKYLESRGWTVTYLPVDREGFVRVADVEAAITPETSILSVMTVNNEIGTVQPIDEIAQIAADRELYFHSDGIQAAGKLPIDLSQTAISTMALSGHKFNAPKGIGILFVRKLSNLMPINFGGGQEMGMLPGTEGLANIVAIGAASEIVRRELADIRSRLFKMQGFLMERLLPIEGVKLTGPADITKRLPGHVSVVLPGNEGEALVLRADLKGVCVSSGSACHHGIVEPSQVLKAIGLTCDESMGSVRISAGALTKFEEVEKAAEILASIFVAMAKKPEPAKVGCATA